VLVDADWLSAEWVEPAAVAAAVSVGQKSDAVRCQSLADAPSSCAELSTHQNVQHSDYWLSSL